MKIKHIIEGIETVREYDEGIQSKNPQGIPEGEDLSWDDPDLVQARKFMAAKNKEKSKIKSTKRDGYTEFSGIDKEILRQRKLGKIKEQKSSEAVNDKKKKIAAVKPKDEIGFRVADIGPGGREHNVKTDAAWDKKHSIKESQIEEVAAPGQEDWIKKNKKRFIDKYGKEKGMSVLYATAWKRSKNDESSHNDSNSMAQAAKNPSGARFGGYYGATQKGAPKPGQGFGS